MQGVYIVIPTYNEAENIAAMMDAIRCLDADFRIVVVDDSSPDGTAEIVQKAQKSSGRIYLSQRSHKLGIGSAIRAGMGTALSFVDCKYVITIDADFSHNPTDIPMLLKKAETADMVQGSRYTRGGKITGWSWQRRFISRVANLLYKYLFNLRQKEITTYFRLYSRKCAECIVQQVTADKFEFAIESVLVMRDHGFTVTEVPIEFKDRTRGRSNLKFSDILQSLRYLAYAVLVRQSGNLGVERFIRFCIVGATGILVNQGLLWILTSGLGLYYLYSGLISIEASIVSNFILNDSWTFRERRRIAGPALMRFLKYNLLCVVAAGLNYAILWFFTDILHFYYLISNLFGIAAAVTWNYLTSMNWAWAGPAGKRGN